MTEDETNKPARHASLLHERDPLAALRRELGWLKRQIRHNERIWAGFREIEIRLIGADAPAAVASLLACELPRIFPRVAGVSLACCDSWRDLRAVLDNEAGHCVLLSPVQLTMLFVHPRRPRLGPCSADEAHMLFPALQGPVGSVALVPLVLHGRLVGSLNQASLSEDHFAPNDATDLLEHLAAVVAMCLENAAVRSQLRREGLIDSLTGVANRRLFEQRLSEEVGRWSRYRKPLACMLADVDHFKQINDRFGHPAGDAILHAIASSLARGLRATDVLARYGGEEFVLLLPGTDLNEAAAIAERLRAGVARLDIAETAGPGSLSVSIGVACLTETDDRSDAADRLIRSADAALYRAKAAGRNRVMLAAEQDEDDRC